MAEGKNTTRNKLLGAIGLAKKAGKALLGTDVVCEAMQAGKAIFVLASGHASENTKRRISEYSEKCGVKTVFADVGTEELGAAVGKRPLACVGITDENFMKLIERNLCESV